MESAPGFWQPDWSNDTLTKAISSAKWTGLRLGNAFTYFGLCLRP
jgi:hypothetical protein